MRDKILLVDDDNELRSEFCDCFDEYDIVEAARGEDALALLKKPNEIGLVVLDFKMPGMDGLTVLEHIKRLDPEKRVVMITGYSSKDVAIKALRGKADNYIEKPFDVEKTRAILESELSAKRGDGDLDSMDKERKVKRVKEFIERNCFKKVTLADAAGAVCLSPKYLSRIFRECAGTGFNDYKLGVKMREAGTLLSGTGLTVEQISAKLGYENAESFIRQFKKIAGSTPSRYRARAARKKPPPRAGKRR
ncbi:MAG: response regulator [Elusimicrobiales bacterium]|nr:response regulator [Elusimicrobiales bacterium]